MATELLFVILNGALLAINIAFVVILLSYAASWFQTIRYYTLYIVCVCFTCLLLLFTLLTQEILPISSNTRQIIIVLLQSGYAAMSVAFYALTTSLLGLNFRYFGRLLALSMFPVLVLGVLSIAATSPASIGVDTNLSSAFYFLIFDTVALFLTWRFRQKIQLPSALTGSVVFAAGSLLWLLADTVNGLILPVTLLTIGSTALSFAVMRRELIQPSQDQRKQLETIQEVGLAITSHLALQAVLTEISQQAAQWLNADASAIYLVDQQELQLAALYQLPQELMGMKLSIASSTLGQITKSRASLFVENYIRDWRGKDELPFARETFGSLIGVPLVDGDIVLGVLLVISARQGRLFVAEDVVKLERLASQAAIAIAHGQLFSEQVGIAARLQELDRIKSEMLRMTSHDLKNPLQAAIANADLLWDDIQAETLNRDEMVLSARNIQTQLQRMLRIISGMLDLERLRDADLMLELCHPDEIMQDAIQELVEYAKSRHIVLESTAEANLPVFLGDRQQFVRALVNLIENAIKFSPAGKSVRITVSQNNHRIAFQVSDQGVGIPKEIQGKIYDRFYRGQQQGVEHVSGTGLGLSLVKTVVENHHGSIRLVSEPNVGSIFVIEIQAHTSQTHTQGEV